MAKIVLTDVRVEINANVLSPWVAACTITTDVNEVVTTAFGNDAVTRVGGLKDSNVQFEFHQDFAASEIESIVYPLIGTVVPIKVRPVDGAIATTNPEYQFNALISSWTPIAGAVGDLATVSVTWPISGEIVKDTTP